jgi:hypothetical protein
MTCLIFNLAVCSTSEGHNQASSMQYIKGIVHNCMKCLIEILILQFNKIHIVLSNYLDVVNENEGFVFAGVVMLWNGLNGFLFMRKLLYFS